MKNIWHRRLLIWVNLCIVFFFIGVSETFAISESKLLASDGDEDDNFGSSISVSGDVAIVGARDDDDNVIGSGSAYVFRWNGSQWIEEQKLIASDGYEDAHFGISVSISGDVALVGANQDDRNGDQSGSAYVFRWNGSQWIEEQKLLPSDIDAYDYFGGSVSISGEVAIVGAYGDQDKGVFTGSAYIFRWNGSSWIEEQKLLDPSGEAYDGFGVSAVITGDRALVGAYGDNDNGNNAGSVYIFRWNGSSWIEEQKLLASDGDEDDYFGSRIAINGDMVLVGAAADDDNGIGSGSAYVFRWNGSSWVEEQKLLASDGAEYDYFSCSVSINGDIALIGARRDDDIGPNAGSVYIFRWNGSSWIEEQKLFASDGNEYAEFGNSVYISGNMALVGAPGDDDKGYQSGSLYVLQLEETSNTEIIYSGRLNLVGPNFNIDIDGDGIADFFTEWRTWAMGNGFSQAGYDVELADNMRFIHNELAGSSGTLETEFPLEYGALIWTTLPDDLLWSSWSAEPMMWTTIDMWNEPSEIYSGVWNNIKNKYLGFEINIEDELHYGWIQLSTDAFNHIILIDYAYENIANTPINAESLNTQVDDIDIDGAYDSQDNCPDHYNPDQNDIDGDGTGDVCDGCRNDPNKTDPGVCGCGIVDTDTDGDGTTDCNDYCPNDGYKITPGECGCGVEDIDSDSDGIYDCNDAFPDNPTEWQDTDDDGVGDNSDAFPGDLNEQYDMDGDGIGDNADTDRDGDSILNAYDINPDSAYEANVSSAEGGIEMTVEVLNSNGIISKLEGLTSYSIPSGYDALYGIFSLDLKDVTIGGTAIIQLGFSQDLPADFELKKEDNGNWININYNRINDRTLEIELTDGATPDDSDGEANGVIVDPFTILVPEPSSNSSTGGISGGGCFIATAAYGSNMDSHVRILRDFRDRFLLTNSIGKAFLDFYYTHSPPIAEIITGHDSLRLLVRWSLLPLVAMTWILINLGPIPTLLITLLFIFGLIGMWNMNKKFRDGINASN